MSPPRLPNRIPLAVVGTLLLALSFLAVAEPWNRPLPPEPSFDHARMERLSRAVSDQLEAGKSAFRKEEVQQALEHFRAAEEAAHQYAQLTGGPHPDASNAAQKRAVMETELPHQATLKQAREALQAREYARAAELCRQVPEDSLLYDPAQDLLRKKLLPALGPE